MLPEASKSSKLVGLVDTLDAIDEVDVVTAVVTTNLVGRRSRAPDPWRERQFGRQYRRHRVVQVFVVGSLGLVCSDRAAGVESRDAGRRGSATRVG